VSDLLKQRKQYDYVITVCDETSAERCPVFPGIHQRIHWGFTDPSKFQGSDEEKLTKVRQVKEEIRQSILKFIAKSTVV
jgi:arsenate reductase